MTTAPALDQTTPAPRRRGLRALLAVIVLIDLALTVLFAESPTFGLRPGAMVAIALAVIYLLLVLNALVFVMRGRIRSTIIALGAAVLLYYVPLAFWWVRSETPPSGFVDMLLISAPPMFFPLLAAIAIALAVRNQRLGLAAVLVCLPTMQKLAVLIGIWGVIAIVSLFMHE